MPQPCATSKCLIYERGILLHNEAAIRIEQTVLHTKRQRQPHPEIILMTNYILRCANGLCSKPRLHFNPVSKEQYCCKTPHRPYGLLSWRKLAGFLNHAVLFTENKLCPGGKKKNNRDLTCTFRRGSHRNLGAFSGFLWRRRIKRGHGEVWLNYSETAPQFLRPFSKPSGMRRGVLWHIKWNSLL